jgi:DNA-binding FadR family transcriptional regulator
MTRYAYEEVAETIRKRIYDSQREDPDQPGAERVTYPPGSMLPPRAELRAEFGRSDQVIGWAMRILHQQGLIETLHGVGVRVVTTLPKQQ